MAGKKEGLVWGLLALCCGGGLLAWNVNDFVQAEPKIRMVDQLNFLPRKEVAKAMSMGHAATLAKLRLIDSYSFFSFVLDSRDDSVGGEDGRGGFVRLYETLIAMDPLFEPFYLKGASSIGGIVDDHHGELNILAQGIVNIPESTAVWKYYLAVLATAYNLEETNPEQLEAILSDWAHAELKKGEPNGAHFAQDWMDALGRRLDRGDLQIRYWAQQFQLALQNSADSAQSVYLRERIREQITKSQQEFLLKLWEQAGKPAQVADFVKPANITKELQERLKRLGPASPLAVLSQQPVTLGLLQDPFGFSWYVDADKGPTSRGLEVAAAERLSTLASIMVKRQVRSEGDWPADEAQAIEWSKVSFDNVPAGVEITWAGEQFVFTGPKPDQAPWTDEDLLRAGGIHASAAE